jgi:hypothetical protein
MESYVHISLITGDEPDAALERHPCAAANPFLKKTARPV